MSFILLLKLYIIIINNKNKMLLTQIKQLIFQKELSTYWYARGIQTALLFLFGAILKKMDYSVSDVFLFWSFLYFLQSSLFFSIDYFSGISKNIWLNITNGLSVISIAMILLVGFNPFYFTVLVVCMQPALRESIHESMIYVRERKHWALGVDVASAFLNEGGKAVGGLSIALFGFLLELNEILFFLFLCFVSISLFFMFKFPVSGASEDISERIGANAKKYLTMTVVHNGAFFAGQAFLSIIMIDKIQEAGFSNNVLSIMGVVISIAMISGLIINNLIKKRLGKNINETENASMLWISLSALTFIVLIINLFVLLEYFSIISPSILAISIGFGIGCLQAIGGFFTIGTLQFLDLNYKEENAVVQSKLKKRVLHWNMTLCGFSPGVFLIGLVVALKTINNLETLIVPFMLMILLIEIFVSLFAFKINKNVR